MMVTAGHGVRMQYDYTGDIAGPDGAVSAVAPRWLRLTRSADTIAGYESGDGTHWKLVGTAQVAGLPATLQAGLFDASPGSTQSSSQSISGSSGSASTNLATAIFDHVSLRGQRSGSAWAGDEIGAGGADIEALGIERGHRTLVVTRKGAKVVTIPLAPRTARALDLAIGERTGGPIFLAADGRRLDRHGAGRIVRRVARRAGITKTVGPHTLRHAFITAALDAGVPLRDVQEAASHADPRTTMRYDRARTSLDRHATYIVAAYVAGAAR